MTHSSEYTNGASLEDCLTNVLALFDLNGIKWRRFCSDSIYVDILDDPVLLTYSECVSSGLLAAWRRIPNQKHGGFHTHNEDASSLKELWIFWSTGDDPDFSRLLKPNLHEGEQGSWESGLSYEGRTLFFKALHNAIERGLLSHGYARFGKYFVIPQKINSADSNKKQKAISFNFFIHGESTVCSSIDIRLMSPVYILNKCHIAAAQSGHQGIKVILCPFGLAGKLTGNGYKYSDPNMARFLNEWNNFFPHHWKREQWKIDGEYPHVVEILACGARMKYPISYVFITEEDHHEAFVHHSQISSQAVSKTSPLFHPSLLTPPMSPVHSTKDSEGSLVTSSSLLAEDCGSLLKRSVSQECCTSVSSSDDNSTLWDFQDPSAVFKCICSRVSKKLKKSLLVDTKSHYPFHRQKESDLSCLSCLKSESLSSNAVDPAMPTLSPQPPVIKEERPHSPTQNSNISTSSSPQGAALMKGRISDEILSPFHASLLNMFENAKNVSKTSPLQPEVKQSSDIESVSPLIEKPCLPKRQYEDSEGVQQPMTGMLYDYQYLNSPLWTSSNVKKSLRCSENSDDVSDCEDSLDSKTPVPSVPKDPYEFTDIDEMAPSEKGFRSIVESYPKEEEIFMPFSMPSPVDNSPAPEIVTSESPPAKNSCPKFIREEDLAVSLHDLENIFDTSSSEEDSAENSFTPAKLPAYDEFSGKIELSRMYPTPPSLEQNAVPSPCYGMNACLDCATNDNNALKDNQETDEKIYTDQDVNVWIPPLIHTFPESPEYSVKDLHFFHAFSPDLDLVYKPHRYGNPTSNRFSLCEGSSEFEKQVVGNVQPVLSLAEQNGSFYNHDNSQDFLMSQSTCDSFTNNRSVGSQPPATPEIHPLIANLLLSDSMLNIFKDINFSCCCLCVCNMNIKGSDAGVILPTSLMPSGNSEPQYKCTCGFSALVHRHKSYDNGLFYEDEVEIYGADCDTVERVFGSTDRCSSRTPPPYLSDGIPDFVIDILKISSKSMISSFSLFHKCSEMFREQERSSTIRSLEYMDGCEVCFAALEEGKNGMENPLPSKLDESFKSSCLHKWPYISSPARASSSDVLLVLDALRPLLQVAIHRKSMQKMLAVTYVVPAPLTWKEFHRLAPRGTEDQCEPQPIPFTLTCHDGDSAIVSPFSIRHWDKLQLEPYSHPRDVAYIVVAPENDSVLCHVKNFFRELSCCYEGHSLGRHQPVTKVLRDGIMRVGKRAASKVAEEPVAEWFGTIGDGPLPNKLRLYARIFKHRLAPHLSTLPLDKTIFESSSSSNQTTFSLDSSEGPRLEAEYPVSNSSSQDEDEEQCPSLVIYVVEPFTFGQHDSDLYRLVTLGLLHSYADMLSSLPEATKNWIHLQIISLDSILSVPGHTAKRMNEMKSLAFSVFSQSHSIVSYQSSVKSLTGFGPAAAQNVFLKKNLGKVPNPLNVYGQPYILASLKDKQTELGEMFGDGRENSGTLHCSYCLSQDKRFIVASCTNDKGDLIETNIINISIPNRQKRKHTSVLKFGLCKLLEFFLEVMSLSVTPWRLIIERFGRLGQGELKTWASLLSRKSLHSYSKRLRERCEQCSISGVADVPCILSVCLVSLEPDSTLRLMPDQIRIVERFGCSRSKNCHLRTPEDASCTHILVFPTSATTQSSQVTFHQEHIDPLPGGLGEDFFEALNDDDINNPDINDIFRWTDSPGNSTHLESHSQLSSPKHPFTQEESNQYPSLISDCQDEPLQLLQQPLALGYYVSTAKSGTLPKWFWSSCPHLENKSPVFFKSALLIHLPYVQKTSDELLQTNPQQQLMCHPMDSNFTTDVLRYVLEGHNTLSWLALDSAYQDRRSCLPIHIQTLIQLYDIVEAIL